MSNRLEPGRTVAGLLVAVTVSLVGIAYYPALGGSFLFDDAFDIDENPAIRSLWPPSAPLASATGLPVRPLPYFSFAVSYAVHGLDPVGWHFTNLLLHLMNGLLVGLCVIGILTPAISSGRLSIAPLRPSLVAWGVASVWLVHPLATQPVAYIYQRIELLAATAIAGAMAVFLHRRSTAGLAATVLLSAVGMLCKETAVAIPPAILLADWLVLSWQQTRPWRTLFNTLCSRPVFYGPLFATWGIAGAVVWWQRLVYDEFADPAWSPLTYALNQPRVILHYLRLVFLPSGQCFDYGMPARETVAQLAPGIVALIAALAGAAWCVNHRPLGAFTILLFFALLAPSSSVIPVNDLCVEHRMYLPLAVILAGLGLSVLACHPLSPRLFAAAALGLMMLLAGISQARTEVYRSRLAVWDDTVAKAPGNPRALLWLGVALQDRGDLGQAFRMYGHSIAIDPDHPRSAKPHAFRAALLGRGGDMEACVREAARAVELEPGLAIGWINLCRGLLELKQLEKAEEAGRVALLVAKGHERIVALRNLASVLEGQGRILEAQDLHERAQALDVDQSLPP